MDVYTTAFTYPRRHRHPGHDAVTVSAGGQNGGGGGFGTGVQNGGGGAGAGHAQEPPSAADTDAVQKMAVGVSNAHGCHVSFGAVPEQGYAWNFLVSGAYPQVMMSRGQIMKECPFKSQTSIKVPRSEILDSPANKPTIKAEVRRRLDDIASQTGAHIAVVNSAFSLSTRTPPDGISSSAGWSGLETERVCELVITGRGDAIDVAKVRLLVMLDELSGLHAESCEIDNKLHNIIAGRQRSVLQTIQEETATNIYFPSPLQGLLGTGLPANNGNNGAAPGAPGPAVSASANVIWITGEFFGVQRARDMLYQVSIAKTKQVMTRDTAILPRKLDWMVTDRADELRTIMQDNATFIQFPALGSSTSLITVFGDHRVHIQRTIRSIMLLACQYYVASFWLLPVQFNVLMPAPPINAGQVAPLLQSISATTGAEVVFKSMCFEMHGLEHEVRAAVAMIMDLELVKPYHHEIRFQLELANEHKEFISGKKNGKLNKIMQTTNAKIKFETFNDLNFLIDISGSDTSVLVGLGMLSEELPAELSFHVPEAYHKRIIGVGGRSIQRIMKKYGVYVKFSNAEEFATLGGYTDNEDNVIARTPAKNAVNLENLKQSVMELVNPKDKDYMNEVVSIPRRYHRTLLGEKSIFIRDIETKTNSKVRFPAKETATDVVTIWGPESQVQIAAAMLLDHVPFEADMAVPPHGDLHTLCGGPDFATFAERIKREYQVVISPNLKVAAVPPPLPMGGAELGGDCSFKFRCQRSNTDSLMQARELLEQFLLDHNVHVYPSPTAHTHKRGDSFTQAFPHFESKLLSSMRTRESTDLGRPSQSLVDRRLRMAASSPDVKALFNGAAAGGAQYGAPYGSRNLEEQLEELETPTTDFAPHLPTPTSAMPNEDRWGGGGAPLPPIGHAFHRTRHSEDAIKRGSDSLLENKMREHYTHSHSRSLSLQNRAQSLDLTNSLSKISESGSSLGGVPFPESPTYDSAGDLTGASNSPAGSIHNMPLFPSGLSGRHSVSSLPGIGARPLRRTIGGSLSMHAHDDAAVDEAARVMSTLGL